MVAVELLRKGPGMSVNMETPQGPTKKLCIIHQAVSDGDEHLVSPQSHASWLALLEAAKVRNHVPILDVAKTLQDKEVPILFYHRKCRSMFTMKRDLETLKRKAGECSSDLSGSSGCPPKKSSRTSIPESRVYAPICIFCSKVKYKKHSNTRETLTLASQLRVDQTLRESAVRKGDGRMIALTSRDIVAAEAHYHTSCYRNYTRNKEDSNENEEEKVADEFILYHKVEGEAYKELFEYIRADIIPNKRIIPVTSLTTKLESLMVSGGVNLLKDSTKKNMHRRLKSELGGTVEIFSDDKGKLLMGNWDLHINGIRTLIPWCFAYDKVNYARYLSAYFAQMTNLPETNPDVHRAFQQGQFSVQRPSNNPFGRIPVDQTIEVTVNKDTQTPGGTSGFSLKAGAIKRYYITAEYRSEFLGHLRDMVHGNQSKLNHADLQQPRIKKDEETVSTVVSLIKSLGQPILREARPHKHFYCKIGTQRHCL